MVLNDGETYSSLSGCKIVEVPDDYEGEVEDYLDGEPAVITEFS